eukprot:761469-Hanusia_phi.AAC.4
MNPSERYSHNSSPSSQTDFFDEEKQGSPSFISKLEYMLKDTTVSPYISWSPCGEKIVVFDAASFSTKVLARYFKHSNFTSFVRQLNLYGFHKASLDNGACEFSHPIFKRGNEHLFKDIRRKIPSGNDRELQVARAEIEQMSVYVQELRARHRQMEAAIQQKENEKQMIVAEMLESKRRQEVLSSSSPARFHLLPSESRKQIGSDDDDPDEGLPVDRHWTETSGKRKWWQAAGSGQCRTPGETTTSHGPLPIQILFLLLQVTSPTGRERPHVQRRAKLHHPA